MLEEKEINGLLVSIASDGSLSIRPTGGRGMGIYAGLVEDGYIQFTEMAANYTKFSPAALRAIAQAIEENSPEKI